MSFRHVEPAGRYQTSAIDRASAQSLAAHGVTFSLAGDTVDIAG